MAYFHRRLALPHVEITAEAPSPLRGEDAEAWNAFVEAAQVLLDRFRRDETFVLHATDPHAPAALAAYAEAIEASEPTVAAGVRHTVNRWAHACQLRNGEVVG